MAATLERLGSAAMSTGLRSGTVRVAELASAAPDALEWIVHGVAVGRLAVDVGSWLDISNVPAIAPHTSVTAQRQARVECRAVSVRVRVVVATANGRGNIHAMLQES